jgi:hypothetical protein
MSDDEILVTLICAGVVYFLLIIAYIVRLICIEWGKYGR